MIYNKELDANTVWKKNKLLEENSYAIVNPDLYISTRRQNNPSNYDVSLERRFFTNIKEENKEKVIEYAYAFPQEDAVTLSKGKSLFDSYTPPTIF
ncbi:hypothetical protein SAMN04488168_1588 [Bacillus sp. 491mf]|nr:hypothetical protein [Bacillus sp. 491mf]SFD61516.1 hypothetical protein SAMN04488168_1588 [Bacillus sp. 491mf]